MHTINAQPTDISSHSNCNLFTVIVFEPMSHLLLIGYISVCHTRHVRAYL